MCHLCPFGDELRRIRGVQPFLPLNVPGVELTSVCFPATVALLSRRDRSTSVDARLISELHLGSLEARRGATMPRRCIVFFEKRLPPVDETGFQEQSLLEVAASVQLTLREAIECFRGRRLNVYLDF